jgi:hypothetical protein
MEQETLILFLLVCKHACADLGIQSFRTPSKKHLYWNTGLHTHALDHAVLTFVVLAIFVNPWFALVLALLDYVAHWHIDFTKSNLLIIFGIPRDKPVFWRIQTFDQIFHFCTYAYIVYLL